MFFSHYAFRKVMVAVILTEGLCFLSMKMVLADDLPINFRGTVVAGACEVASLSKNMDVILGDIPTMYFGDAGDVSTAVPFTIDLNCPDGASLKATVTFSGTTASDSTLLALDTDVNVAKGVAVRINESDGTKISLGTASAVNSLVAGDNELKFTAQYQALVGRSEINAGSANATAQFTLNYP
ncbi:fimbrial protein [Citrobacter amalonaticus]|uniref:fimbrial protein n=1 Tax=Citrobacter amalonaticus TaxID=35703 RepID=UPI00300CAC31